MTDEQQVRSLLTLAAELPDDVRPQVGRLLERGRRKRTVRAAASVLGAIAIAVAAFALPAIVHALGPGQAKSVRGTTPLAPGLGAAELARFHWSALPPSPLGRLSQPVLAWTGTELLELGGIKKGSTTNYAAAFTLATGRWHLIAPVHANVGFSNAVDVWTGHQLFIANGTTASCLAAPAAGPKLAPCLPHAGLYDPATSRWATTLLPNQMAGFELTAAVWNGRQVILAAIGVLGHRGRLSIAAYDPASDHWQIITPALPSAHPPLALAMVATPNRVILWSLWSRTEQTSKNNYAVYSGVDVLALGPGGHRNNVTGHWPQHTVVESPMYGGGDILIPPGQIWCGLCSHPAGDSPAKIADATTLALTEIPGGPLVHHPLIEPPIWLWTGSTALAANVIPIGPPSSQLLALTQMATFDPAANRWTTLPGPPRDPIAANPLWAGHELLLLTASGGLLAFRG